LQVVISADISNISNSLLQVNKKLDNFNKTANKVGNSIGGTFTKSFITAQVVMGVFNKTLGFLDTTIRGSISVANQYESALVGLSTVAGRRLGQEAIPLATQAAKDLAEDGLMSVADAANGLKNLLNSGFGLEESINLMNAFKDS